MADKQALVELAERCEAATGPSLALDNAIRDLVGEPRVFGCSAKPPYFTVSLDAAMTLVPEGMAWSVDSDGPTYRAGASIGPHLVGGEMFNLTVVGEGETPALALCAAALRALSGDNHD